MPETVVLKVIELRAQAAYAARAVGTTPVGDLLYAVDVPDSEIIKDEFNNKVITKRGLQLILMSLEGVLVADKDEFS